jgi:hypothetical protein
MLVYGFCFVYDKCGLKFVTGEGSSTFHVGCMAFVVSVYAECGMVYVTGEGERGVPASSQQVPGAGKGKPVSQGPAG